MNDITLAELLDLHARRIGKEPSRALPSIKYKNPERHAKAKGVRMELKAADSKLQAWWVYTRLRDSSHGYPKEAPYCREAVSSRQWESTSEIADAWRHSVEMEQVDEIINSPALSLYRAAICSQMRNYESGAQVWRSSGSYADALDIVDRLLRDAGLL